MTFCFYATKDDLVALFRWMDGTGNFQFLEESSRPDLDNRVYESFSESEWSEHSFGYACVWPIHAGSQPKKRSIVFEHSTRARLDARGRTILESPALIRFSRTMELSEPYVSHTEMRFETEHSVDKLDRFSRDQIRQLSFVELNKAVAAIKKQVKYMAVARWRTMPVMPGVADLCRTHGAVLWCWGKEGTI